MTGGVIVPSGLIVPKSAAESLRDRLTREAIAHGKHLWPLIQEQQDPSKLDEAKLDEANCLPR